MNEVEVIVEELGVRQVWMLWVRLSEGQEARRAHLKVLQRLSAF